jgi:hypothetical protein
MNGFATGDESLPAKALSTSTIRHGLDVLLDHLVVESASNETLG